LLLGFTLLCCAMLVRDLIEFLEAENPDAEVLLADNEEGVTFAMVELGVIVEGVIIRLVPDKEVKEEDPE